MTPVKVDGAEGLEVYIYYQLRILEPGYTFISARLEFDVLSAGVFSATWWLISTVVVNILERTHGRTNIPMLSSNDRKGRFGKLSTASFFVMAIDTIVFLLTIPLYSKLCRRTAILM